MQKSNTGHEYSYHVQNTFTKSWISAFGILSHFDICEIETFFTASAIFNIYNENIIIQLLC